MKRALMLLALTAAVAFHAVDATACWNDYTVESRVGGVAADGWFFTSGTSWSEAGDGADGSIDVYDETGAPVESLYRYAGTDEWKHVPADGAQRAPRLAGLSLGRASLAAAGAIVAKHLGTTPLRPVAASFQHVKSGVRCGSIARQTQAGPVRVFDVGEIDFIGMFCPNIVVSGFRHPASQLEFVRARWRWVGAEQAPGYRARAERDTFSWYRTDRVEGLELALRGQRTLDAGKAKEALPMLERSIRLAPEYVPSRRAFVWAAARADMPWSRLQATLQAPIPDGRECIAWAERDAWMDLPREHLPWKEADEITATDASWPWDACSRDGARFYRVDAKGDAVH